MSGRLKKAALTNTLEWILTR